MKYFYIALLSMLFISACSETKDEETIQNPHPQMTMGQQSSTQMFENPEANIKLNERKLTFENVEMLVPATWLKEKPTSSMRVIQFFSKNNNHLVVAGFYFGNRDNMVEPNIERWKSQFTEVDKFSKIDFADGKNVLVQIEGTHKNRPSEMVKDFEAVPGYKTIAAIVSTNKGPYFFKMVGPLDDVNKELENFKDFLNSYKKK